MFDTSENTNLKDQYAAQVAADLERNEKEQEQLKAQLAALEQDHALLVTMRDALGSGALAAAAPQDAQPEAQPPTPEAGKSPRQAAVPRPRRANDGARSGVQRAKKPAGRAAKPAKAKDSGAPTLRSLVTGHLAEQHEPRSVSEVTAALTAAHPDRAASATVVRNTLENLVAKGRAERTKQGSSVYYTALRAESSAESSTQGKADVVPGE
ncbi:BlaI/MecI/CopY family transcriptional regulator [Streptomyces sp. SYSU K217416]